MPESQGWQHSCDTLETVSPELDDRPGLVEPLTGSPMRAVHDADEWNDLVLGLGGSLEQGYGWGEVLRGDGWSPRRYAVSSGSTAVAGLSIMARRLPGLPWSLLYVPRGPAWDGQSPIPWEAVTATIRDVAADTGAIFLRLSPGVLREESSLHQQLVRAGFAALDDRWTTWNAPRIVLRLDVDDTEDAVFSRVRKTTRNEIRGARKRGIVVRPDATLEGMQLFHGMLLGMGRRKGYPVRSARRLEALWRQYIRRGDGVLLMASHDGVPVGGMLGVKFGRRVFLQYSAVLARRLDHGPLLYWEFIRWARDAGATTIEWGGSGTQFPAVPADPGYGVYRFKSNFGARLELLTGYYDFVFRPALYRAFRLTEAYLLPAAWRLRAMLNPLFARRQTGASSPRSA